MLDTADIDRYPADGSTPAGVASSPVSAAGNQAAFVIGGGAQCAAPCADRAEANLGPDVWLSLALQRAAQIAGVRAFLYTGPRVTTGETEGPATLPIPYGRELDRYAGLLASNQLPVFAAPSPTDLAGGEGEVSFEEAFCGGSRSRLAVGRRPGAWSPPAARAKKNAKPGPAARPTTRWTPTAQGAGFG